MASPSLLENVVLFSGTAHPELGRAIAEHLGTETGSCAIERFPDGEITVELQETVRRKEVFILQPTSPPVNEHLVELLAFVDCCRRSSAQRITVIVPYFGYARSDKRQGRREPVSASMVATLLQSVGVDHVVTVDLHAPQIEGFFHVPFDSLTAVPMLSDILRERLPKQTTIVSPDAGRMRTAMEYARHLDTNVAVMHKQRTSGTETSVTHIVGDVQDRPCLIVDDMIATGGTIGESIEALLDAGAAHEIRVVATHGLLLRDADKILRHDAVHDVYLTDTLPLADKNLPHLHIVSVAPLIANAIQRFMTSGPIRDIVL